MKNSPSKSALENSNDNVKVVCRVRPLSQSEKLNETGDPKNIPVCTEFNPKDRKSITIRVNEHQNNSENDVHNFNFDYVFSVDTQQTEVYEITGIPILTSILQGFNGCILAYGQTGSGKTFTMQGEIDDPINKGLIPRIIDSLFEKIGESSAKMEYTIKAGIAEIYNEKIHDLLDISKDNLSIREDKQKGTYIEDLTEISICSASEIYKIMHTGNNNRTVAATKMNAVSSRSHSIFIMNLTMNDLETFSCKTAKLYLVDLAGSEMVGKTGASGKTLEEAKNINKSLTMLGRVINALTDGKSEHIPYRDSKLTRILQNSIGGNAKTCLIVTASPAFYNSSETLSTCRFGARAKNIKNNAIINKIPTIAELELIISKLQKELAKSYSRISNLEQIILSLGGRIPAEENIEIQNEEMNISNLGIPENKPIKIKEEEKQKVEVSISKIEPNNNPVKEKVEVTDVDTLLDQLKKERNKSRTKTEKLQSLTALLTSRTEEIEKLKKLLSEKETELKQEKEKNMSFIISKIPEKIQPVQEISKIETQPEKIITENSFEKSLNPTPEILKIPEDNQKPEIQQNSEISEIIRKEIEKEREINSKERTLIIEKVGTLTAKNIELIEENEQLTEKIKRLELTQTKDGVSKIISIMQDNMNRLNEMYHQKLNQCAIIKNESDIKENAFKRVLDSKSEMAKQIINMKEQINLLVKQCEELKGIVKTKMPEGEKILLDLGLNNPNPVFLAQQNVVKVIRGGQNSAVLLDNNEAELKKSS